MEKSDVKQRFVEFCKYSGISKNKFEQNCGLTRGYLANPTTQPSTPVLEKVHAVFPELNMNWLLFGEGEMLINKTANKAGQEAVDVDALRAQIEDLKEQLADKEAENKKLDKENRNILQSFFAKTQEADALRAQLLGKRHVG